MNIKLLIVLTIVTAPLFAGDASVTPYLHEWFDARKVQMKFNFDYNQYDTRLTQTVTNTYPALPGVAIGNTLYANDMVKVVSSVSGLTNNGSGSVTSHLSSIPSITVSSANEVTFEFAATLVSTATAVAGAAGGTYSVAARIGIYDDNDGIGLISSGSASVSPGTTTITPTFGIFVRNNGVETVITSLNGTLPTDARRLNLYRLVVNDKTMGPILFQFFDGATNLWVTMHTFTHTESSLNVPYLRTLTLPLSVDTEIIINTTTTPTVTADVVINTTDWTATSVGDPTQGAHRPFAAFSGTKNSSSTEQHVMTIKNNGISGAKRSYISAIIKNFGGSGTVATWFQLYKNATLSGTSFSNVDVLNSIMQMSTAGTYTVGTGTKVFATTYNAMTGNVPPYVQGEDPLTLYPGETLTITSQLPFDSSGKTFASITWDEVF